MDTGLSPRQRTSSTDMVGRGSAWLGFLAGIWLIASPYGFALDFSGDDTSLWSTLVVGVVAIVGAGLSILRLSTAVVCFGLLGIAGLWAVIAPYVLNFEGGSGSDAGVNSITLGIVLVVLSVAGYFFSSTIEE